MTEHMIPATEHLPSKTLSSKAQYCQKIEGQGERMKSQDTDCKKIFVNNI
jgi:hypothetical protein